MKLMPTLLWIGWAILMIGVFGWFLYRSREPGKLVMRWVVTAAIMGGIWLLFSHLFKPAGGILGGFAPAFILGIGTAAVGLVMGIIWAPSIISWLISPLSQLFYDEHQEVEPKPLYSAALAQRKKGNYPDALAEVEGQLSRFPNDLQGTLLLAEIQAVDLHDLTTAEQTLEELIAATDAGNAVVALNQMADWRLSLDQDLEGTRAALRRVQDLCPGTEAAYMAGQRLAHLTDPEMVAARQSPKPIPYVEFPRPSRVGEVLDVRPKPVEPGPEASELVKHLQQYPEDFEARERLATLYAEHFRRMDLARSELEELIGNKRAPRKKVVAWLNRLADLEIRVAHDIDTARAALQRIIDADPKLAAAEQARRRMDLLTRELRGHTSAPSE